MPGTYRGLGFDPAPGDLSAVTEAATGFTRAADALSTVAETLHRAAAISQAWQGEAAEAFRARLPRGPGREPALRHAAGVLDRWAGTLTANQRLAEELDTRATRLRKRLDAARDLLQDKQNAADLAASPAAAAEAAADLANVSTLVTDLESTMDDILARARALLRDHLRAADAAAAELSGAPNPLPAARKALDTVAAALGRASRTSAGLAGLILPAGRSAAVPSGAAGAVAAALGSAG